MNWRISMAKFVNTSMHPVDTSEGGNVAPGEVVEIDEVDDHIKAQVDAGLLVEVEDAPKAKGGKN
jgi:hypothetical protein